EDHAFAEAFRQNNPSPLKELYALTAPHSARRIPSGFLIITSQLESAPTAMTSAVATATPSRLTEGIKCQFIFKACSLTAQVSAIAADEPSAPASSPRAPYSTSRVLMISFLLAPSVLRMADS